MHNWFFTDYSVPSEKNGEIFVHRRFGHWWITVKGCGQTSQYTHQMWKEAFKRLCAQPAFSIKNLRILMLGLGAGGQIKTIYENFPGATLTVVEYDPAMVQITKELQLYAPYPLPILLEGDAAEILPRLSEQFDVIILDLFSGPEPSPLATSEAFARATQNNLARNGQLIVNVYGRPEYLNALAHHFLLKDRWMFRENSLAIFSLNSDTAGPKVPHR